MHSCLYPSSLFIFVVCMWIAWVNLPSILRSQKRRWKKIHPKKGKTSSNVSCLFYPSRDKNIQHEKANEMRIQKIHSNKRKISFLRTSLMVAIVHIINGKIAQRMRSWNWYFEYWGWGEEKLKIVIKMNVSENIRK